MCIDLTGEEPCMVAKLVHYFYNFDYDDEDVVGEDDEEEQNAQKGSQSQCYEPSRLATNAALYIMGDRYNVTGLKSLAKAKFTLGLANGWNSEDFPDIIRSIYENTPPADREMRGCILPTVRAHWQDLRTSEPFMEVVREMGDFGVDLIDLLTNLTALDCPLNGIVVEDVVSVEGKWCSKCRMKRGRGVASCPVCDTARRTLHLVILE